MLDLPGGLFSAQGFLPHGYCIRWFPQLLWTMVVSDAVIALSYFSIPLALLWFLHRQPDMRFRSIFVLFSLFIMACGTTHLIAIANIWHPVYRLDALVKMLTAAVSVVTAVLLWPLIPQIIAYLNSRSDEQQALAQANRNLGESLALLERRSRDLTHLTEISARMQAAQRSHELCSILAAALDELHAARSGAIWLRSKPDQPFECQATWGAYPADMPGREDNEPPHMSIPLAPLGEKIGFVQFRDAAELDGPTVSIMKNLLEQAGMMLANIGLRDGLEDQAVRDPLTGLHNRRFFEATKTIEEIRSGRSGVNFVLAVFDLDDFKRINDKYGHEAGDAVLREFGNVMRAHTRRGDLTCRYGGEEFVAIMPGADEMAAYQRSEAIRKEMLQRVIRVKGRRLPTVTVSVGISTFSAARFGGTQEVFEAADLALYRAKRRGKNRTEVSVTDLAWPAGAGG